MTPSFGLEHAIARAAPIAVLYTTRSHRVAAPAPIARARRRGARLSYSARKTPINARAESPPRVRRRRHTPARAMSEDGNAAYGAETFAEGNWYHELLEDGLALSYRVRARRERDASAMERKNTPRVDRRARGRDAND